MGIHGVNLTERNEKVYKRFFGTRGRNGQFSKFINSKMNQHFTLDKREELCMKLKESIERVENMDRETHKEEELQQKLYGQIKLMENKIKVKLEQI